jgi:hypothetical protein
MTVELPMAEITTDHNAIRKWAERHGGKPAAVDRTHKGDDVGIIRIMFPNAPHSEHGHLVEISWDDFFREFEERQLALVFDPNGLFSKIISRDTAEQRSHGGQDQSRHSGKGTESSDREDTLRDREYRDDEGNVHHHTRSYMERHGSKD